MSLKKGVVHIVPVILVFALLIILPLLIIKFVFKKGLPFDDRKPTVAMKSEYSNPFDKKSQYVNPFSEFKNPFTNLNK